MPDLCHQFSIAGRIAARNISSLIKCWQVRAFTNDDFRSACL